MNNRIISFDENDVVDVDKINSYVRSNGSVTLKFPNTKSLSSELLRRLDYNIDIIITGPYDDYRFKKNEGKYYKSGVNINHDFLESSTFSRNELVKIMEKIERIESYIPSNWDDLTKVIYIYDKLKKDIMYDPKYESKTSKDIRSLRGLVSSKTVCAGYAVILKEFLDRQNIRCHYISGLVPEGNNNYGGHAWNVVEIDGKLYSFDLTWENTEYRKGNNTSFDYFGQNIEKFNQYHIPYKDEKMYGYQNHLSTFNINDIKRAYLRINSESDYDHLNIRGTKDDGSKIIVSQIGDAVINGKKVYRYYYGKLSDDGTVKEPLILYGEDNLNALIKLTNFPPANDTETARKNRYIAKKKIINILFSDDNIRDSLSKGTYYVGGIKKNTSNKMNLVDSYQEISKPKELCSRLSYPSKRYVRSNGSNVIVQQMYDKPVEVNGHNVMQYHVLETLNEYGKTVVRKNTIYTTSNLFKINDEFVINRLLDRGRLNEKSMEGNPYVGAISNNGTILEREDLNSFFRTDTNKKINKIPTFDEMKNNITKYELFTDSDNFAPEDTSKYKIRDKETGQIIHDANIRKQVIFSYIWKVSAGVKVGLDPNVSIDYAFNEKAKDLYEKMCDSFRKNISEKGIIDTVSLLREVLDNKNYKYDTEIIIRLFRTPYQTQLINDMFVEESCKRDILMQVPQPLYSEGYAGKLLHGNDDTKSIA